MATGIASDVLESDFTGSIAIHLHKPNCRGVTDVTLTAGRIDNDAHEYFGRAYCHWLAGALAGALAVLTGWGLVVVEIHQNDAWRAVHTAARTPQGEALDIFGIEPDEASLARRYSTTNDNAPARTRRVEVECLPGDVLTGIDDFRGNPMWWAHDIHDRYAVVFVHFARLLLTHHGYARCMRR